MPSASDYELNIGRTIEVDDVLTARLRFSSSDLDNGKQYAVTSPPDGNGDFRAVEFISGVGNTTNFVTVNKHRNAWGSIVKHEDRTDIR